MGAGQGNGVTVPGILTTVLVAEDPLGADAAQVVAGLLHVARVEADLLAPRAGSQVFLHGPPSRGFTGALGACEGAEVRDDEGGPLPGDPVRLHHLHLLRREGRRQPPQVVLQAGAAPRQDHLAVPDGVPVLHVPQEAGEQVQAAVAHAQVPLDFRRSAERLLAANLAPDRDLPDHPVEAVHDALAVPGRRRCAVTPRSGWLLLRTQVAAVQAPPLPPGDEQAGSRSRSWQFEGEKN